MENPSRKTIIPLSAINEPRNPGCRYCIHYQTPSVAVRNEGACIKFGRKIKKEVDGKRYQKWIECENPRIKNKNNRCKNFVLKSPIYNFFRRVFVQSFSWLPGQKRITEKSAFVDEQWGKI